MGRPGRAEALGLARAGPAGSDPKAPLVSLDGQADFVSARAATEQARLLTGGQPATHLRRRERAASGGNDRLGGYERGDRCGRVSGVEVTLAFTGAALSGAGDRAVRVDIAATADAEPVLAVPLTAVLARPDGSTFVTAVRADGTTVDLTVTTGRTAGGWVAVSPADPDGLAAGAAVVVGKDFR